MNNAIHALLTTMLNKRYIGAKHTPEKKILAAKTRYLDSNSKKEFQKEYKELVNLGIIIRERKRTGKANDWHISLQARKLPFVYELLQKDEDNNLQRNKGR